MSIETVSTLEKSLALEILGSPRSPLSMLSFRLSLARSSAERSSVTKEFIENYLSKDGQPIVVDLQDKKISELFDKAMKNMVQDTVEKALKQLQQLRDMAKQLKGMVNLTARFTSLMGSLKSKTWKGYAEQSIKSVKKTVSEAISHVISKKQPVEKETAIVLIEEPDDWHEVETDDSYNERVFAILKNWQKNPSIPLEIAAAHRSTETLSLLNTAAIQKEEKFDLLEKIQKLPC